MNVVPSVFITKTDCDVISVSFQIEITGTATTTHNCKTHSRVTSVGVLFVTSQGHLTGHAFELTSFS